MLSKKETYVANREVFSKIEMYALNCFYNYYFNRAFEIVVAARSYLILPNWAESSRIGRDLNFLKTLL